MEFPIYAAQQDRSVWYIILSEKHFIEWKRLGPSKHPLKDTYLKTEVRAEDYATYVYVADLIASVKSGEIMEVDEVDLKKATK
jgi:hypothetical protein